MGTRENMFSILLYHYRIQRKSPFKEEKKTQKEITYNQYEKGKIHSPIYNGI